MFDYIEVQRPYPGLRPFEPHEGEIFFGREGHTDRLLEILQRERFLAVVGPSGGGKSSLVRAGLLPALAGGRLGTGSHWRLALLRPGEQPILALAQALLSRHGLGPELCATPSLPGFDTETHLVAQSEVQLVPATIDEATPDAALIAAELRQGPAGLIRLLAQVQMKRQRECEDRTDQPPTLNLLVLVDQFEELFTHRVDEETRKESLNFVNLLLTGCGQATSDLYSTQLEALNDSKKPLSGGIRLVVALTMRSDFLGRCVEFSDLPEAINRSQYLTPRLRPAELRAAIVEPARLFGGDVDGSFADAVVNTVQTYNDQLPQVQHALSRWWQAAWEISPNSPQIDAHCAVRLGNVQEALDRHAEEVFLKNFGQKERLACEALFRAITSGRPGADAVRSPRRLSAIAQWGGVDESTLISVVRTMAAQDANFLHFGKELSSGSLIDLSHEVLARQWTRLKEWVADEQMHGLGWRPTAAGPCWLGRSISSGNGILVTELTGAVRGANRRFAQLWDLSDEVLDDRHIQEILPGMRSKVAYGEGFIKRIIAIQSDAGSQSTDQIRLRSGRVLERVTQPQLLNGIPCGRIWIFFDPLSLAHSNEPIDSLRTTDYLTGLYNRRHFTQLLESSSRIISPTKRPMSLIIVDLDHFNQLNVSLGMGVGDQLLQDVAQRLKTCLRPKDTAARLGGNQFGLLLHDADERVAEYTARRVLGAVSATRSIDGLQFTLTCSAGIAMFGSDSQGAESIMDRAEAAMRRAKAGGRGSFRFHEVDNHARDNTRQRLRLDNAMRQGLASGRFRMSYQPQVDLKTGRVVGAEAMIRWRDPEFGEVSPGQFVPIAEDSGFIIALGDWALKQAMVQASHWRNIGIELPMSVNVSAVQFHQPDFIDRVANLLQEHQLDGALLELELTESTLVLDAYVDVALSLLSRLSLLGVRLAIDDFGTGYSSLAYLKRFPIDRLKIARSFVKGVPTDKGDSAIVRAIVQLAKAIGVKVVADGVETQSQHAFLHKIGCDYFQGFFFAPALPAEKFEQLIQKLQ